MTLPAFQYLAPAALDDALGLLNQLKENVVLVAGGTEITGRLKQRLLKPSRVVSLRNVPGLSGIRTEGAEIVIGPMTTVREVAQSPVIAKACSALSQAAHAVAAPPIRNIATIGGNLLQNTRCLYYNQSELVRKADEPCLKAGGKVCLAVKGGKRCFSVYQGDIAPVLVATGAKVKLAKKGSARLCAVSELFSGSGESPFTIAGDELVTEIRVPVPGASSASSFKKLRLRGSLDYPLASAAVLLSVDKGVVADGAIVIGACGASPAAVIDVKGKPEAAIDANEAGESAAKMVQTADNLGMPGSYRRKMIRVMTVRAVSEVLAQLRKAGS